MFRSLFRFVVLIGLFLILFQGWAQKPREVVIEGKAEFATNYKIRVITFSDYINWDPIEAASTQIARDGSFKLSFQIPTIQLIRLEINSATTELFVVPGLHYQFKLDMDPTLFTMFNPADENGFIQMVPYQLDTNDLNYKIGKFEVEYGRLLEKYGRDIIWYKSWNHLDSLITELSENFPIRYEPTNYYLSYIYYTVGQLEAFLSSKDPQTIYQKYFDNDYILYNNPAYMNLFNYYFNDYLLMSPRIPKETLNKTINENADYLTLFNEVGKDFSLVNERLRELVLIKNLAQMINNEEINQKNVTQFLNHIATNTRFPEHQPIAINSLNKAIQFNLGASVPEFSFKYADGSLFHPEELEGQWVYYHFFSTQCVNCIREMTLIQELQNRFEGKVTFVGVAVDPDFSKFLQFRKKYPQFDWTLVHFNDSYSFLRQMEITSLPEYLMMAPDGTLYNRYPRSPEKGLTTHLLRLLSTEKKEGNPLDPRHQR